MSFSVRAAGVIAALTLLSVTVLASLAGEPGTPMVETGARPTAAAEQRVQPAPTPATVRVIDLYRAKPARDVVILPPNRRPGAA